MSVTVTGAPVLCDALASFDCVVREKVSTETHTIYIGRVVGVHRPQFPIDTEKSTHHPAAIGIRQRPRGERGSVLVGATLGVAGAILTESALSFLGFGVQPPATSWGALLDNASGYVGTTQAYLIYFPGLMIFLTVLAVNFLGDGLRDALDPQSTHA